MLLLCINKKKTSVKLDMIHSLKHHLGIWGYNPIEKGEITILPKNEEIAKE